VTPRENCDFAMDIKEINVEDSESFQRYVNECCESESDGKIDGFVPGCLLACTYKGTGSAKGIPCIMPPSLLRNRFVPRSYLSTSPGMCHF
jgi:hypothetical protein